MQSARGPSSTSQVPSTFHLLWQSDQSISQTDKDELNNQKKSSSNDNNNTKQADQTNYQKDFQYDEEDEEE